MVAAQAESKEKLATSAEEASADSQEHQQADEDEDDDLSIWGTLKNNITTKNQPKNNATSRAIIEVQRYLETDMLPRHEDPLKFWKEQHFNFPNLSIVVQERFCVLGTSVPCERQFSRAGQIITDRRNRLTAKKAEQLIFLNSNYISKT